MPDLFSSARSLLRRADHHIANLKIEIEVFGADKPYTYLVEDNSNGTQTHRYIFNETWGEDVSCIVFDAINNLRSCLDQMTYAVAMRYRPSRDPENYAKFPFTKVPAEVGNMFYGIKVKDEIPPEIIACMERTQPYRGGNNTLWAINHMANTKKHAILIGVGFGASAVWESWPGHDTILHGAWVNSKNEIAYTSPTANQGSQRNFTYTIVIDDPEEIINRQPPIPLLKAMRREVAEVLIAFEGECRTLGFL